jgi:hypothetical protein
LSAGITETLVIASGKAGSLQGGPPEELIRLGLREYLRTTPVTAILVSATGVQALWPRSVAITTAVEGFLPVTLAGAAMEFRVIWEIDIEAEGVKEAAQQARAIQLTPGMSATVFDVWAHGAVKMHRVDLVEESDRLKPDELVAVRAGLRLLQCKPGMPQSIQDVAAVMLVFLDQHSKIFTKFESRLFG